jgi:hypothetical protein
MAGFRRFNDFHAALTKAFGGDSGRAADFLARLDALASGRGGGGGTNSYGVVTASGSSDRLTATQPGATLNVLGQGSLTATVNKATGTLVLTVTGTTGATDAFRTFRFAGPTDVVASGTSDIFHFVEGAGISLTPATSAPKGVEIACTLVIPGGTMSVTLSGGNYSLVNDNATPGNSKYYGTDSGGTKGFFDLPSGGSGLEDAFVDLVVSDTAGTYTASGADTLTLTGGTDIEITRSGANVTVNFTGSIPTVPGAKNSIEVDSGDLQLVGDTASPGNNKVYGTDGSGNRTWKDDPSGGSGLDDAFANLIASGTGGTYNATGADTLTLTAGTNISVTRSGANVTIAFTGSIPTVPGTKNSIEEDGGDYQLVGDTASPGNTKLYGTDGSGNRGWYDQPSGGGGGGGEPKKVVWARDITPRFSNGCGDLQLDELTAGNPDVQYLPFFPGENSYAQFLIPEMPANWNLGTITATIIWAHPATTTNFTVRFGCSARVVRDDDAIDAAFGTPQVILDTGGTTGDVYKSSATPAITPSGTAGAGCAMWIQVFREGSHGDDTMAVDANVIAVVIEWGVTP